MNCPWPASFVVKTYSLYVVLCSLIVCVLCISPSRAAGESFFPFGVYDKSERVPGDKAWEGHYRQLIELLHSNNINTLLTIPYHDVRQSLFVMDLANAKGLRVIMGTGNPLNGQWDKTGPTQAFHSAYLHPSVIAIKTGDEPNTSEEIDTLERHYDAFRAFYPHPIVTAMVGDGMTGTDRDFALQAWATLRTNILFVRHYPIRRQNDLINWPRDKLALSFDAWTTVMERYAEQRSWWFILQAFGRGVPKTPESYWRLPSNHEIEAMSHLALAQGARGIIAFCLQTFGIEKAALVDADLRPMAAYDGSYPLHGMKHIGGIVEKHSAFLLRHKRDSFTVQASHADIVTVPRVDPFDQSRYVYAINKNTTQARETVIRFTLDLDVANAVDLYTGLSTAVTQNATGRQFPATLAPGQGQLWRLVSATPPSTPQNLRATPGGANR